MSPLPSPEERRKRLKIPGLIDPSARRTTPLPGLGGTRSAATVERAEQRKEGRRRNKQPSHP